MLKILAPALLFAAPSALLAAAPATHEVVHTPGKSIVTLRPIERAQTVVAKCHPDSTKAVLCEATQRSQQVELASRTNADAQRLTAR